MCDQQSLRPACAYAQPDQSLCLSLEYSMIVKLLTERHLEFLSITGGCRGPSESTLVKMSNCWKSRALAHFLCLYVFILSIYVGWEKKSQIFSLPKKIFAGIFNEKCQYSGVVCLLVQLHNIINNLT